MVVIFKVGTNLHNSFFFGFIAIRVMLVCILLILIDFYQWSILSRTFISWVSLYFKVLPLKMFFKILYNLVFLLNFIGRTKPFCFRKCTQIYLILSRNELFVFGVCNFMKMLAKHQLLFSFSWNLTLLMSNFLITKSLYCYDHPKDFRLTIYWIWRKFSIFFLQKSVIMSLTVSFTSHWPCTRPTSDHSIMTDYLQSFNI